MGCSFSPFLADLPGVELEPFFTVRYAARTPCHQTCGRARRWPAQWQRRARNAKRASRPGGRRKPLSNPHWAMLSHSLPSGFTSQGFWQLSLPNQRTFAKRRNENASSPCAADHSACSIAPGITPAPGCMVAGLGPSSLPGFQKPGLPSTHTQPTPTHQLAFASRCGHGSPGVPAGPSKKRRREKKKHEALAKCKIANSLDDVFIAEGRRVVKQFRGPMYSVHTRALLRVMPLFRAPPRRSSDSRRPPQS